MAVVTKMGKYLKGAALLSIAVALAGPINLSAASPGQCTEITENRENRENTSLHSAPVATSSQKAAAKAVGYFGAELNRNLVLRVRKYSPAGAAGLAEQDVIKSIDNIDVSNLDAADTLFLLQGHADETSELKIKRGDKTLSLLLKRTECPQKIVPTGLTAAQYWVLGTQMLDMGWPDAARKALQLVISQKPSSSLARKARRTIATELPLIDPPLEALELNNRAWNLCHLGHTAEDQALLEECIKEYPGFEWPYQNLSTLYSELGLTSDAESTTRALLEKNPKDVTSWCNLASFQIQQGHKQAALKSYKVAHSLDPENERVALLAQWLKEHKL